MYSLGIIAVENKNCDKPNSYYIFKTKVQKKLFRGQGGHRWPDRGGKAGRGAMRKPRACLVGCVGAGKVSPQARRRGPLNRELGTEAGEVPCAVGEPDALTHGGAL